MTPHYPEEELVQMDLNLLLTPEAADRLCNVLEDPDWLPLVLKFSTLWRDVTVIPIRKIEGYVR
jgi:hypothetical protein